MAENLLSVITLPTAPSADFNITGTPITGAAGDKIYTYWDDSTEAIVAKIEKNTGTAGSNLGAWGDSGNFETVETGWLGSETGKPTIIPGNLTRSSTVAHAGTYSAKLIAPNTSYVNLIYQYATVTAGKIYNVSCWVYVPSGTPLASSGNITFVDHPLSTMILSNIVSTTIADCTDTWVQITATASAVFDTNPLLYIKLSGGTPITNGVIYFDEFYVNEDTGYTSVTTTLTDGPNLPDLAQSDVNNNSGTFVTGKWNSGTSFCSTDGLYTLNTFYGYLKASEFPYAIRNQAYNHFSCLPTPWVPEVTLVLRNITPASSQFDEDGGFEVLATTNANDIRYTISDTDPGYSTSVGQSSGVFSGLYSGTYKVWANDDKQGAKNLTITIPYSISNTPQPTTTNTYSEKYRLEYKDLQNGVSRRVMVYERGFNGTYVEVKGGATPFVRELTASELNDKFDPIRETNATVNFMSERDLQFIGLFSQDDRKFQVRYEYPIGSEVWRGYVVPSVFSEPYTQSPPYETTITATDGLILLEDEDFLDRDGNKYEGYASLIVIIANILDKLDLGLSIRVAANISEDAHNGVKPFEETEMSLSGFYEEDRTPWKCTRVLRAILMPFGAKLVQEDGYWNIVRIEEQTATYNTRIYDADGTFNTTGTKDPILAISSPSLRINSAFINRGNTLEIQPAYGKITINHKLFPKVSLLDGYSFEDNEDHTLDWDSSSQTFNGWNINKVNSGGGTLTVGPEIIPKQNGEDEYGLSVKGLDINTDPLLGGAYVKVTSKRYIWRYSGADSFTFSFKYLINTFATSTSSTRRSVLPLYVRLRYQIQKGDLFFNKIKGWTDSSDEDLQWNDLWVSDYGTELTETVSNAFLTSPSVSKAINTVYVSFMIEGRDTNDIHTQSELENEITATKQIGYRIKLYSFVYGMMYFVLKETSPGTVWPSTVQPTSDYHASTNDVYWELENNFILEEFPVSSVIIDDVRLNFFPNFKNPPEEEVLEQIINKNYKESLEVTLEGGDVTGDAINNKFVLYNTYFLDQNRQPTDTWTRDAVSSEATSIQNILLKSLVNQYRYPSFRFSGSLVGFTEFGFLTTLKHTQTAPSLSLTNEEFTGSSTGWSNSDTGTSWAYDSNDVQVTLSGATDSKLFGQSLTGYAGQRISIEHSLTRSATSGTRGDWLICALTQNGNIVQEVVLEDNILFDSSYTNLIRFSFDNDFDAIHFYIRNIAGTGDATYNMDFFRLVPLSIERYYTPNSITINDKMNEYTGEWTQLIPVVFSSDPTIDNSGEGNTTTEAGGGTIISGSGGDFNNDFSSDFNI